MVYFYQGGEKMYTTTITAKGQIVIPAKIRKKLGITQGIQFSVTEKNDQIILQPLTPEYIKDMVGILAGNKKVTRTLLHERKRETKKENKK